MSKQDLGTRSGLPDTLRILMQEFPRAHWQTHANFGGMVQFWLQRHLMFRDLLDRLQTETRARFDNATSHDKFAPRLSRLGGMFLQELHGHHQIEDTHYFPQLIGLDQRLERGFDILDSDHHAIDGLLNGFAEAANAVLNADGDIAQHDATGRLTESLDGFQTLLDRHLVDEEELIVPVILKTGFSG